MDPVSVDRAAFREHGYLSIPDVFPPEELRELRRRALAGRDHQGDLLSHPALHELVYDDRLLAIARTLLGATPVYFGASSCNFEEYPPQNFHKDNVDRYDAGGPDWRGDYSLLRFGLYLQDHARHSGGLAIREGSHEAASRTFGRERYLGPPAGALLVWDMRLTHRGRASLYRWLGRAVDARLDRRLPRLLKTPAEDHRIALFIAYGRDDAHLERHLRYLRTREDTVEKWLQCHYDPAVLERARAKGLVVRDMAADLRLNPPGELHRKHHQIPY